MSRPPQELLTIDVEAEIRKLCGEQFSGDSDHGIALVRSAIFAGARKVRVLTPRGKLVVRALGARMSRAALSRLVLIADTLQPSGQRHRAVLASEKAPGAPFLALLSVPGARLVADTDRDRVLVTVHEGGATLVRAEGSGDVTVELPARTPRKVLQRALVDACKYAAVPIEVGGEVISRGPHLEDCVLECTFADGTIEGRVGLPRSDTLCRTVYLVGQIVLRESFAVSPRGAAQVAIVHDRSITDLGDFDSKQLKRTARAAREGLYAALRERYRGFSPRDRRAARDLLLRRCERESREWIRGLPLFERLGGGPVDVDEMLTTAQRGLLLAVERGGRPRPWLADPRTVFVFDERERQFTTEHLELTVVQPAVKASDGVLARIGRHLTRAARTVGHALRVAWGALLSSRPVASHELSSDERAFVRALEAEIRSGRYSLPHLAAGAVARVRVHLMERGSLPARLRRLGGHVVLGLPRRNPLVQQAVRAYRQDPRNLYPIFAALLGGHDGFGRRKIAAHRSFMSSALRPG